MLDPNTRPVSLDRDLYVPEGCEFVAEYRLGGNIVKLYYGECVEDPKRRSGRAFPLVAVNINGSWVVTRGTCNHIPAIEAMDAHSNGAVEALARLAEALSRLAEAREAAQRSQEALARLAEAREAAQRAQEALAAAEAEVRRLIP